MCTALMPSFALLLKKEMWSKLAKVSWKWPCAILLTAEAAILLHRLYRKYYGKEIMCAECGRARPEFTKVLFFPDPQIPCFEYLLTLQGCTRKTCTYSHDETSSFIQLIRYVLNARRSIDLCMFSLTCNELATAVKIKHNLGAKVRIITDTEYMNLTGSKIQMFLKEGIAVRHDRSSYHMHHKFLVIDETIVLTGSFNWTHTAVIGNNENVLATNNVGITASYLREFERLWKKFNAENGPAKTGTSGKQTPASGDANNAV